MRGITSTVGVVILVAIAAIMTIGVYFWAAGMATKPQVEPPHVFEINAELEDYAAGQIRVYNIDTVSIGAQKFHIAGNGSTCVVASLSSGGNALCTISGGVYGEVTIYGDNTTAVTLIAPAS